MKFLVDAQTIYDFFNGKTELFHFFEDTEKIYVSVISQGELYSKTEKIKKKQEYFRFASDFCHLLHILDVNEPIAIEYSKLKQKYPDLEQNKLWLCATAITRDLIIVSQDKDYLKVKEIVVKIMSN